MKSRTTLTELNIAQHNAIKALNAAIAAHEEARSVDGLSGTPPRKHGLQTTLGWMGEAIMQYNLESAKWPRERVKLRGFDETPPDTAQTPPDIELIKFKSAEEEACYRSAEQAYNQARADAGLSQRAIDAELERTIGFNEDYYPQRPSPWPALALIALALAFIGSIFYVLHITQ